MKIINRLNCLPFILSSTLVFAATFILAQVNTAPPTLESKWETATEEELSNEINRIGAEIRQNVDQSNDINKKLEFIWSDPNYTSETVEIKRKALKDAEAALIKAQIELRSEITKLPEVQKISEENRKLQESIIALRFKNTALVRLFRSRKTPHNTNN